MTDETTRARSGKTLVVYYSLTGNTARVARDIARRTGADLESIRDREHGTGFFGYLKACFDAVRRTTVKIGPLSRDPAQYALTVIGTPVWAGNIAPAVRGYLERTRGRHGRIAFFATSGNTDIARILPTLEEAAEAQPVAEAGFNAQELQAQEVYEAKLATFLKALQWQHVAQDVPTGERARAI